MLTHVSILYYIDCAHAHRCLPVHLRQARSQCLPLRGRQNEDNHLWNQQLKEQIREEEGSVHSLSRPQPPDVQREALRWLPEWILSHSCLRWRKTSEWVVLVLVCVCGVCGVCVCVWVGGWVGVCGCGSVGVGVGVYPCYSTVKCLVLTWSAVNIMTMNDWVTSRFLSSSLSLRTGPRWRSNSWFHSSKQSSSNVCCRNQQRTRVYTLFQWYTIIRTSKCNVLVSMP